MSELSRNFRHFGRPSLPNNVRRFKNRQALSSILPTRPNLRRSVYVRHDLIIRLGFAFGIIKKSK
eukprot:1392879-Amorphochlora_amoeboformis.AAC.2